MPQTISCLAESKLIVRKSQFIGSVRPVADRAAARDVVIAVRRQHPDAEHVCWALLAGGHGRKGETLLAASPTRGQHVRVTVTDPLFHDLEGARYRD